MSIDAISRQKRVATGAEAGRPVIAGVNHMVSAGHYHAATAAFEILERQYVFVVDKDNVGVHIAHSLKAWPALLAGDTAAEQAFLTHCEGAGDSLAFMLASRALSRAGVPVVARAREENDAEELLAAGAAEVVPEALESSVMLATHALAFVGVPLHRIVKRLRELREQHYGLLRGFFHGATDVGDRILEADLPRLHSVALAEGDRAVGMVLGKVGLGDVGATVSALRRHGLRGLEPDDAVVLEAGDVVVLLGTAAAVMAGETKLLRG